MTVIHNHLSLLFIYYADECMGHLLVLVHLQSLFFILAWHSQSYSYPLYFHHQYSFFSPFRLTCLFLGFAQCPALGLLKLRSCDKYKASSNFRKYFCRTYFGCNYRTTSCPEIPGPLLCCRYGIAFILYFT